MRSAVTAPGRTPDRDSAGEYGPRAYRAAQAARSFYSRPCRGFIGAFEEHHRTRLIHSAPDGSYDAVSVEFADALALRADMRGKLFLRKAFGQPPRDRNELHETHQ